MVHMETFLTLGLSNALAATAIAVVVGCLSLALARRPAWLHCLWLLVLVKLVTPPLFTIPIGNGDARGTDPRAVIATGDHASEGAAQLILFVEPEEAEAGQIAAPERVEVAAPAAVFEPPWPWPRAVVLLRVAMVWVAGTLATLGLALVRIVRFSRLLRHAYPAPEPVQDQTAELARRMGLRRSPLVWWIDAPLPPMLWAVGCRARLVVPRSLWKGLSAQQQSLLLAHELAHLRRGDHFLRIYELFVTALFWWLPVVWWARHALRDAEEQCCDAWVVWAFPEEARTYAETLLDTVDFLNPSRTSEPLLACGFGRAHHLRRRLTMIMLGTTPRRLGKGSALMAFTLAGALLPLAPSWAQKPDEVQQVKGGTFAIELAEDEPKEVANANAEVHLVVTTDGETQEVKADSLDKATEIIKQKVETITRDGGDAQKHPEKLKALQQALAEIQKARANAITLRLQQVQGQEKAQNAEANAKLSAETRAQIDKARAHVDVLRKEMEAKRAEFQKAQAELAMLSARAHIETRRVVVRSTRPQSVEGKQIIVGTVVEDSKDKDKKKTENRSEAVSRTMTFITDDQAAKNSDHARLDSLEKKLEKLLEEVSSLKKQEKKEK